MEDMMQLALPFPRVGADDEDHVGGQRITQLFDANPQNYRSFGLPAHEGVDFGLAGGTPLYAVHDGIVSKADNDPAGAYGKEVRVIWDSEGDTWETIQAHCDNVVVKSGQRVEAGDLLALSGNTGRSTGAHLHFSLMQHGARTPSRHGGAFYHFVDPLPYLREAPALAPTPPANSTLYQVQVREGVRVRRTPVRLPDNILGVLPYRTKVWLLNDETIADDGYIWRKIAPGQLVLRLALDNLWCAEMPTSERPRYLVLA